MIKSQSYQIIVDMEIKSIIIVSFEIVEQESTTFILLSTGIEPLKFILVFFHFWGETRI